MTLLLNTDASKQQSSASHSARAYRNAHSGNAMHTPASHGANCWFVSANP
jgi:hypothetical protein